LKSINRIEYKGKHIFRSQAKKMDMGELGVQGNDIFTVCASSNDAVSFSINRNDKTSPSTSTDSSRNLKASNHRPSQQRSQWAGHVNDKTLQDYKDDHSAQMEHVWKEAESKFEEIRKMLNDLCIQRTDPKSKSRSKAKSIDRAPLKSISCNVGSIGLGSKAGKGSFVVNVGEVDNLYRTSKHCKQYPTKPTITLDLHHHTKKQAVTALNQYLPSWIDTAMNGVHPYVIQVEIVCGKGSQVLSEVVEQWIKCQRQVAKAPKKKHRM
jgi:hypothetical protein